MAGWIVATILGALLWKFLQQDRLAKREAFIRSYSFPKPVLAAFGKHHDRLTIKDRALVGRGLRQFFLAYLKSGQKPVSMPSQVVDELWHEFILYTKAYDLFCKQAFGKFFHHVPSSALSNDRRNNEGLRRAWWYCCKEENINPRNANRLPLLFALDTKLEIANGFLYAPDCKALNQRQEGSAHCGGDFSSLSFDGTTDGLGDSSSGGGDGDGGGCGGGD